MLRNLLGFLEANPPNRNLSPKSSKASPAQLKEVTSPRSNTQVEFCGLYVDDSNDDLVAALETDQDAFSRETDPVIPVVTPDASETALAPAEARAEFLKIALQQPIENRLVQAGLLSPMQLRVITQVDCPQYPDLSIDEILLLRNWVKPETLEFFLRLEAELSPTFRQLPLERRLQKAALVNETDIQRAYKDQSQLNCNLDQILVLNGVINRETADYFVQLGQ